MGTSLVSKACLEYQQAIPEIGNGDCTIHLPLKPTAPERAQREYPSVNIFIAASCKDPSCGNRLFCLMPQIMLFPGQCAAHHRSVLNGSCIPRGPQHRRAQARANLQKAQSFSMIAVLLVMVLCCTVLCVILAKRPSASCNLSPFSPA